MAERAMVFYKSVEQIVAEGMLSNDNRFGFEAERPEPSRIQAVTLSAESADAVNFIVQFKNHQGDVISRDMHFVKTAEGWRVLVPTAVGNRIMKNF